MNARPFSQTQEDGGAIHRVFSSGVDDAELRWHRDERPREVTFVSGGGWSFQLEGEVPIPVTPGRVVFIPAMVWHRLLHEGGDDLHARIIEL